jgi:hypothetical protein
MPRNSIAAKKAHALMVQPDAAFDRLNDRIRPLYRDALLRAIIRSVLGCQNCESVHQLLPAHAA